MKTCINAKKSLFNNKIANETNLIDLNINAFCLFNETGKLKKKHIKARFLKPKEITIVKLTTEKL